MLLHFGCPNCGADMTYNIGLKKLHCDHCDYSEEFGEDKAEWINAPVPDGEIFRTCPNCGGEIPAGKKTCSTKCEYCGTSLIITERLNGDYRPDSILPFALDKTKAVDSFMKWCHNGRFAPAGFTSPKNIENLKPLYIPFWIYDLDTSTSVDATATKVNIYVNGDTEFTETEFFDVHRTLDLEYDKIPYDASEEVDDTLISKVLPYNFDALTEFRMPYLAGFMTEQRDYASEELAPLVKHQVEGYISNYANSCINGYSSVRINNMNIDYRHEGSAYAYLPLWFISYPYLGKNYIFAMNGQTGKVIGEPPVSMMKIFAHFGVISFIIFLISLLIGGLF